jgi:hypothetical protein
MLIRRSIAAADVTAFGASAKMKPPTAQSRAFDATSSAWLGRRVDTIYLRFHNLLSDFLLLQLLRIDAVFGGKPTCRHRGAAQVVARLTLGEAPRSRHGGLAFVS